MGKLHWYKRDPNAALVGMRVLSCLERGAYNTILDLIYAHDGSVTDDDRYLAGNCGLDIRVWRKIRARLFSLGKLYLADGKIRNLRADIEVKSGLLKVELAQNAGRASGRKRAGALNKTKDIAATPVERNHELSTTTSTTREGSEANASGAAAPRDIRADLFNRGLKSLAAMTGKTPDSCRSLVGRWLKSVQDEAIHVLAAIEDAERNRVADPVAWINKTLSGRSYHDVQKSSRGNSAQDGARRLIAAIDGLGPKPGGGPVRSGTGEPVVRLLSEE